MKIATMLFGAVTGGLLGGCEMLDPAGDGDGGTGGDGKTCSSARLVAGSPGFGGSLDEPSRWNPSGHPAFAEPPLRMLNLAGRGSKLLVSTQQALWQLDLAAANPTFARVFGDDVLSLLQYRPTGTCAAGRMMAGDGLALLPDGRAVIGDAWGNGVLELSDPFSASCAVKSIAGTQVPLDMRDLMTGQIYEPGDVVGPGAQARFRRPNDATSDAAGNLFVWDDGNESIKKIANDAARTVSKVFDLPTDMNNVNSMATLGGKLYAAGGMSGGDRIVEIDLTTGAVRDVVRGAAFPEAGGSTGNPIAMTSDGRDLIVFLWKGYIYRVSLAGEVTLIAGKGRTESSTEAAELDPAGVPALELPLEFSDMVDYANLYWNDGHLFVTANYGGVGMSIWDLTCD